MYKYECTRAYISIKQYNDPSPVIQEKSLTFIFFNFTITFWEMENINI